MELKILLFINLLAYSFVISQSLMYIIALADTQRSMGAVQYIGLRQLLDKNFRKKYSIVIYTTLISSTSLLVLCSFNLQQAPFISALIGWLCLVADIILTLKGNMPINNTINSWTKDNYPADWESYRSRWLVIFSARQAVTIIGFAALLAGIIFGF